MHYDRLNDEKVLIQGLGKGQMAASLVTHRDIRSLSGALAVAHAIRRLVAGGPRDPSLMLWLASDLVKDERCIAADYVPTQKVLLARAAAADR